MVNIKGQLVSERQMTKKEVEHVANPGPCFRDGGQEARLEHKHRDCAHRGGLENDSAAIPCVRRINFLCSLVSAEPGIWSLSGLQPQLLGTVLASSPQPSMLSC